METQDIHRIFSLAAQRLRERSPNSFDCWFVGVQFESFDDGTLCLRARDEFVRDWVREHYQPALLDEIVQQGAPCPAVSWIVGGLIERPVSQDVPPMPTMPRSVRLDRPAEEEAPPSVAPPAPARIVEVTELKGVSPKNTFENFIVGPSNQLAYAAAVAASGGGGRRYNPLFLCGSTGLGKTHLLHAIAHTIHERRPDARIVYGSADSFTNEYITALTERRMDEFRARYHHCDVLLIDDVQSLAGRTQTQEEYFNTFNVLHALDRQIVIAADKYPQQLDRMDERLVSRFTWGLVADVQTPGLETRAAILLKKAQLEHVALSDEVAVFLAQTVQSNVRELEGMLIRLIAKSSLLGIPLDLGFAQSEMAAAMPTRQSSTATVEQILKIVCKHFHIATDELLSQARHRSVSKARHIAMYLCRQRLQCSFPEIGRAFNNRDHTTVMSAVRKVQAQRDKDPELRAQIEAIERRLTAGE